MGKLKLTSWLSPNLSAATDSEKKNKRLSLSAFSASPFGRKSVEANGRDVKAPEVSAPESDSTSRMMALAQKIAKETEKVEAYLKENNLPSPSFDVDAPTVFPKLPEDISKSRQEIMFATRELGLLAQGPRESVRWAVWEFLDVLALQVINHFGIGTLRSPSYLFS